MIVKMIILRLLCSSDDKDRRSSALKALRSEAPEEPTHEASVHPMVVSIGASNGCRMIRQPGYWHKSVRI